MIGTGARITADEKHALAIIRYISQAPGQKARRREIIAATKMSSPVFNVAVAWIRSNQGYLAKHGIAFHSVHEKGHGWDGWFYRITNLQDLGVLEHQARRAKEMIMRATRNDTGALAGLETGLLAKGDLDGVRQIMGFRAEWQRAVESGNKLVNLIDAVLASPPVQGP